MDEDGYYIVIEGTNIRNCTRVGAELTPLICDTADIAQKRIDETAERDIHVGLVTREKCIPIQISEYNEKYSEMREG